MGELSQAYALARRVIEAAGKIRLVSHIDLDGIAAAAIIARWAKSRGVEFSYRATGVRGVYRAVRDELRRAAAEAAAVVVADVSLRSRDEADALTSALKWGQRLVWLDHHVWDPSVRTVLEEAGALILVDRERVTASIACLIAQCGRDEVSRIIEEVARADDSCSNDPYGLAERWRLVLRVLAPRNASRVFEAFVSGTLWPQWAEKVYAENAASYYGELREKTRIHKYSFDGLEIQVATVPPKASACDVERLFAGVIEADVIVILYPSGMSIRTMRKGLRADCIASKMGGGGHATVAGAPRPSLTLGPAHIARMIHYAAVKCLNEGEP
ncbi:MAG: hypothetical protein DSY37_02105 [Hyperthermus sp.]|nr:MAG: hypothetical protein DSY37_02105 [Hyperthermus sp.]